MLKSKFSKKPKFQIVMATYNGEKFIDEQINSIMKQIDDGELLIHDDGSTDDTKRIIAEWAARDKRIKIVEGESQGGACANFAYLLEHTQADYVFCSDQDDIWKDDKILIMMKSILFYESVFGKEYPLLICSDLILIDKTNVLINNSMMKHQNLNPRWVSEFNLLLTQNVVTGCTMLLNRSLLSYALPIPKNAVMHDHWLALVACAKGKIIFLSEGLVFYRQHENNQIGAHKYNTAFIIKRFWQKILIKSERKNNLSNSYLMADAYARIYPHEKEASIAEEFAKLRKKNQICRLLSIINNRFYRYGFARNINWILGDDF